MLVPYSLSKDFSCSEMVQLLFQRLFHPDKNKNLEEVLNTVLGIFFGQVLDVDVQLCTYIFFFSLLCVGISRIFCRACVSTPFWDTCHSLPTSFCALLLELSGFMWGAVWSCREGGGGGGGGLCWQACRPDPWLHSFFRAGALAVVTGSSSRRMAVCCNTQQCVGVVFVI